MFVTRKQHCVDAASFWSLTGAVMIFFGTQWVWIGFGAKMGTLFSLGCILLGVAKGEFAIGKAAKKAVLRIQALPEKSQFWQVFGWKQWLIVLLMMSLGMMVRVFGAPKPYRGLVLTVVGTALLWASRYFWRETSKF